VDIILCPTYVGAAAEHGTAHYWLYTSVWNLLDQPCVVFPSGLKVNSFADPEDANFVPLKEIDMAEQMKYSPKKFKGAP
jgi:amidase